MKGLDHLYTINDSHLTSLANLKQNSILKNQTNRFSYTFSNFNTTFMSCEDKYKGVYVHQFQEAVNMIFRPKKDIKSQQQTDQKDKNQKIFRKQAFSIQKSLSVLKKLKDYILPFRLNFNKSEIKQVQLGKRQRKRILKVPKLKLNQSILTTFTQPGTQLKKNPSQSDCKFNLMRSQHIEGRKIKYFILFQQNNDYYTFLIGNQNQIDCIHIFMKNFNRNLLQKKFEIFGTNNRVQTQLLWSLTAGQAKSTNRNHTQKGKISNLACHLTSSFIVLQSSDLQTIQVYKYNKKQIHDRPVKVGQIFTSNRINHSIYEIISVFMIKQSSIIVFYNQKNKSNSFFQIYTIEQIVRKSIKKVQQKQIKTFVQLDEDFQQELKIIQISQPFQKVITIFLESQESESGNLKLFDLYIIQIDFTGVNTKVTEPKRVYSIQKSLRKYIKFQNFSRNFFLLNIGNEILVVMKQGYMVDSAKITIFKEKSLLMYMGRNRLLLVTQTKIQEYSFKLNQNKTPYRIQVCSIDSMKYPSKIAQTSSQLLTILPLLSSYPAQSRLPSLNYIILMQTKPCQSKKLKGEIQYSLSLTKPTPLLNRIRELFSFQDDLSKVSFNQIQQRVDIAKKIGMTTKEVYLELWNRTNKHNVQDYRFLLDTLHYQTIIKEIQKKLKKQAMLFTQIYKIQFSCFELLKKTVKLQCTENDIKDYIVSHFKLSKLQYFKDVEMILNSQNINDRNENSQLDNHKLTFGIQDFYTYTKLQLKSYLLQLFRQYFFEIPLQPTSKPDSPNKLTNLNLQNKRKKILLKIKIAMNHFRFLLKIIYQQFLQELLKLLKGDRIIGLLKFFPQILPSNIITSQIKTNTNNQQYGFLSGARRVQNNAKDPMYHMKHLSNFFHSPQPNSIQPSQILMLKHSVSQSTNGQIQLQGIWLQTTSTEWQKFIYLDTIQTIYNKRIINQLSKSVWYKRNLYYQHDFIFKTRKEIEQHHLKLKSHFIVYFFIDKVYQFVNNIDKPYEPVHKPYQLAHHADSSYKHVNDNNKTYEPIDNYNDTKSSIISYFQGNFSSIIPQHLKNRIQLYHKLFMQMKKLLAQYKASTQAQNPRKSSNKRIPMMFQSHTSHKSHIKTNNNIKNSSIPSKSLYQKYAADKQKQPESRLQNFQTFLMLNSDQLFLEFFKLELVLVGCIFQRIKPVFQFFHNGKSIFNSCVDQYFMSSLSQVKHLKCILNRLNSESREFQFQHFALYQVLVKAIMNKVKIGKFVPPKEYINVDELIIYIRDIYMMNSSQIKAQAVGQVQSEYQSQLKAQQAQSNKKISLYFSMLQCISTYKQTFQSLRIQISLYDIYLQYLSKTQKITQLLIQHLIAKHSLHHEMKYQQEFLQATCQILAEASEIISKLFSQNQLNYATMFCQRNNLDNQIFFNFLWKLIENQNFLYNEYVSKLINDPSIKKNYLVDQIFKYRFLKDQIFVHNIKFLKHLLQFLDQENKIKKYFMTQIQFVLAIQPLNKQQEKKDINQAFCIRFPITENSQIISIYHMQQIFINYSLDYLKTLNYQHICKIINQMQQILINQSLNQHFSYYQLNNFNTSNRKLVQCEQNINNVQKQEAIYAQQNQSTHPLQNQSIDLLSRPNKYNIDNSDLLIKIEDSDNSQHGQHSQIRHDQFYSEMKEYEPQCEIKQIQMLIKQSARPVGYFSYSQSQYYKKTFAQQKRCIPTRYLTSPFQLYQVLTKYLIQSQQIKQSLPYLQKLLELSINSNPSNIDCDFYIVCYPLLILNLLSRELVMDNRILLARISYYMLKNVKLLINMVKRLVVDSFGAKQLKNYLEMTLKDVTTKSRSNHQLNHSNSHSRNQSNNHQQNQSDNSKYQVNRQKDMFQNSKNQLQSSKIQNSNDGLSQSKGLGKRGLKKKLAIQIQQQQFCRQGCNQSNMTFGKLTLPNMLKLQTLANQKQTLFNQKQSQVNQKLILINQASLYQNPLILLDNLKQLLNKQTSHSSVIQCILNQFFPSKQIFKQFQSLLLIIILLKDPYLMIKYFSCRLKTIKFKWLFAFFNQIIKINLFQANKLLQFIKRMFYMLYCQSIERTSIEYQLRKFIDIDLNENLDMMGLDQDQPNKPEIQRCKCFLQSIIRKQKKNLKKLSQQQRNYIVPSPQRNKIQFHTFSQQNNQLSLNDQINTVISSQKNISSKSNIASDGNIDDSKFELLEQKQILQIDSPRKSFDSKNILLKHQQFHPTKQRDLVYSRGDKKLLAMLSNSINPYKNSNQNSTKYLSPKSIRSSITPMHNLRATANAKVGQSTNSYFSKGSSFKKQPFLPFYFKKQNQFNDDQRQEQSILYEQQSVLFQQNIQQNPKIDNKISSKINNKIDSKIDSKVGKIDNKILSNIAQPPRLSRISHQQNQKLLQSNSTQKIMRKPGHTKTLFDNRIPNPLKNMTSFSPTINRHQDLNIFQQKSIQLAGSQITQTGKETLSHNQPSQIQEISQIYQSQGEDQMLKDLNLQVDSGINKLSRINAILHQQHNAHQYNPKQLSLPYMIKQRSSNYNNQPQLSNKDRLSNNNNQQQLSKHYLLTQYSNQQLSIQEKKIKVRDKKQIKQVSNLILIDDFQSGSNRSSKDSPYIKPVNLIQNKKLFVRSYNSKISRNAQKFQSQHNIIVSHPNKANSSKINQQLLIANVMNRFDTLGYASADIQLVLSDMDQIYKKMIQFIQKYHLQPKNTQFNLLKRDFNTMKDQNVLRNFDDETGSLDLSHSHYEYVINQNQQSIKFFTKSNNYELIMNLLDEKIQKNENIQQVDLLSQQLKDKLFHKVVLPKLIDMYTSDINIHMIAKLIQSIFKKKIFITDFYYQYLTSVSLPLLNQILIKSQQQDNLRKVKYSSHSNTSHSHRRSETSQLNSLTQTIFSLLEKIPLNILQFRKKELILSVKSGKPRKTLLDVMVKVFQKKKDNKLAQQLYNRMKPFIDKDN